MEQNEYQHGIMWMDWQHKDLIKEFNSLHDACEEGSCALTLMKSSKALERYVEEHFGLEEAYMQKFAYPNFKKHQREHLAFRQKFKDFHATGLNDEKKVGTDLLWMMMDWIMKHIMVTDKELAKFLTKKRLQ